MSRFTDILFFITILLLVFSCSEKTKYNKDVLTEFFQTKYPNQSLDKVLQSEQDTFDKTMLLQNNIEVIDTLLESVKDSLFQLIEKKENVNHLERLLGKQAFGDDVKNVLAFSKDELFQYYESLAKSTQESFICNVEVIKKIDLIKTDKAVSDFFLKEYEQYKVNKKESIYSQRLYIYYLSLINRPDYLKEVKSFFDDSPYKNEAEIYNMMLSDMWKNGDRQEVLDYFKKGVNKYVEFQRQYPNVITRSSIYLTNKKLMIDFLFAEDKIKNDFINFSFKFLEEANILELEFPTWFVRVLVNSRQLSEEQETRLIQLLEKDKMKYAKSFASIYKVFTMNVDSLKNMSEEYIKNEMTFDPIFKMVKAELSVEDKKYLTDFLEKYHLDIKKDYSMDFYTDKPFIKQHLNNTLSYQEIQSVFANMGIEDKIPYEEFRKKQILEATDKATLVTLPYRKGFLVQQITEPNIPNVSFFERPIFRPLPYKEHLDSFSRGVEETYGFKIFNHVDVIASESRYSPYTNYVLNIYSKNSKVYKIKILQHHDTDLHVTPMLSVLNKILKEEKVEKRWIPVEMDYRTKSHWLMEPAVYNYLNETVGIHF